MGTSPSVRMGVPPPIAYDGDTSSIAYDGGTTRVDRQTDACQIITFPRTSYAGGNKQVQLGFHNSKENGSHV